jgi:hypothetical protein
MALKDAALLALIGMTFLTVLLVAGLILDIMNVARGLIPATTMLSALVHSFAALAVTVFFYVVRKEKI